ncbi:MAG TPA: cytochrome c maturation protein CcmE [Fimbriimonadaceae bacterium]|nr:cytochrome c maturation protein CcmE [Fimbriimonadaceae bacterium]
MSKSGVFLSIFITIACMVGLGAIFVTNASPYATVAQAKESSSTDLHVAGKIVKGSEVPNPLKGELRFTLKDGAGVEMPVVYKGPPPANLSTADMVVVKGGMKDRAFHARDILVKCPSRYEKEKGYTPPNG